MCLKGVRWLRKNKERKKGDQRTVYRKVMEMRETESERLVLKGEIWTVIQLLGLKNDLNGLNLKMMHRKLQVKTVCLSGQGQEVLRKDLQKK